MSKRNARLQRPLAFNDKDSIEGNDEGNNEGNDEGNDEDTENDNNRR